MGNAPLAAHVRAVFADELGTIQSEEMRRQVVSTWVRAMEITGTTDLLRDIPIGKKFLNAPMSRPALGLEHVRGVCGIAAAIAKSQMQCHDMQVDLDVVLAGALLHDVGKLLERAPAGTHPLAGSLVRHHYSGMHLALEQGVPTEVLHVIAYHSAEGHRFPRTLECYIVYTADLLSIEVLERRELGSSRAEQSPYVYVPRGSRK